MLIISGSEPAPELEAELAALREVFARVLLMETDVKNRLRSRSMFGALGRMSVYRNIVSEARGLGGEQCGAVLSYGDVAMAEAAVRVGKSLGCPSVVRLCGGNRLEDVRKFLPTAVITDLAGGKPMAKVKGHLNEDREFTLLGLGNDDRELESVIALAISRPSTRFCWRYISREADSVVADVPANLKMERCDTLEQAVEAGPIDWAIDLAAVCLPTDAVRALSAGIPLIAIANELTDEVIDDDCAVIFGPEPTKEEFVRGLLPYLESDYRREQLRHGAARCWEERLDIALRGKAVANKILQKIEEAYRL